MINIPAIMQNYDSSDVDLIMTITTPCLAGACNKVKQEPVGTSALPLPPALPQVGFWAVLHENGPTTCRFSLSSFC